MSRVVKRSALSGHCGVDRQLGADVASRLRADRFIAQLRAFPTANTWATRHSGGRQFVIGAVAAEAKETIAGRRQTALI
jgi:hypothetical protein